MMVEEIEDWHRDKHNDRIVEDFDHAMSDLRYFFANTNAMHWKKGQGASSMPTSRPNRVRSSTSTDPVTRRIWAGMR